MDLQFYIQARHKLLDKFEANWEKRALRDPQSYPIDLSINEWDKQFDRWLAAQRQEEKSA